MPPWDGELAAIGLASPADLRVLVYLFVMPRGTDVYVACEIPSARDDPDGLPCEAASSGSPADYEQGLGIVQSPRAQ